MVVKGEREHLLKLLFAKLFLSHKSVAFLAFGLEVFEDGTFLLAANSSGHILLHLFLL